MHSESTTILDGCQYTTPHQLNLTRHQRGMHSTGSIAMLWGAKHASLVTMEESLNANGDANLTHTTTHTYRIFQPPNHRRL